MMHDALSQIGLREADHAHRGIGLRGRPIARPDHHSSVLWDLVGQSTEGERRYQSDQTFGGTHDGLGKKCGSLRALRHACHKSHARYARFQRFRRRGRSFARWCQLTQFTRTHRAAHIEDAPELRPLQILHRVDLKNPPIDLDFIRGFVTCHPPESNADRSMSAFENIIKRPSRLRPTLSRCARTLPGRASS